jgi:hypothetical protein
MMIEEEKIIMKVIQVAYHEEMMKFIVKCARKYLIENISTW